MECIGCTACIDACDSVMTKIQRPTGLIRYDSKGEPPIRFRITSNDGAVIEKPATFLGPDMP